MSEFLRIPMITTEHAVLVRRFIVWLSLPLGLILFSSLWMTESPGWHIGISLLTLILGFWRGISIRVLIQRILPLLIFLLLAQLILSPYSRDLLSLLFEGTFEWGRWKYPLFAVERLALPLIAVMAFQRDLADPRTMRIIGAFVEPLSFVKIPVAKFQLMLAVALKFLPLLRGEWERFYQARLSYQTHLHRQAKGLRKSLRRNIVVLKAMISHIIRKARQTGDMLALRGTSLQTGSLTGRSFTWLMVTWSAVGVGLLAFFDRLLIPWSITLIWYSMMQISLHRRVGV